MKKLITVLLISASCSVFAAPDCGSAALAQKMNASQLAQYNGHNAATKNKSYVALNGCVYDVTNVDEWHGGKHYKGMVAGTDLTPNISKSPHGASIVKSEGLTPVAVYVATASKVATTTTTTTTAK